MGILSQIIAVVASKKANAKSVTERVYHAFQKPDLFNGQERYYIPRNDGEGLPSESKKVQQRVDDLLKDAFDSLTDTINVVATQDTANCKAKADIKVAGQTLAAEVPVTHLLFLEKTLTDIYTFCKAIPTLDIAETWRKDGNSDLFTSTETPTNKTAKVQEPLVLYPATPEHPAQTQIITKDIIAGTWQTKKLSAAWEGKQKDKTLARISKLKEAVVLAREEANSTRVEDVEIAGKLIEYIVG